MRQSPRIRRLRNDLKALEQLAAESSIFSFKAYGEPPDSYIIRFHGVGLWKPDAAEPQFHDRHEVHVRLGASYPRMMPELAWKSPIFHPNISASGIVCLGGYGTYWVPSLTLDELCTMLWDMIRYENYDEKSPYNREAALWVKTQNRYQLPLDGRPLRDRIVSKAALSSAVSVGAKPAFVPASPFRTATVRVPPVHAPGPSLGGPEDTGVTFLDPPHGRIVPAQLADSEETGIVFLN
jgi:ubiquitin-protein ligase